MAGPDKPAPLSLRSLGLFTQPTPPPPARRGPGSPGAAERQVPAPPPAPLAFLAPWFEGAVGLARGALWGAEGERDIAAAHVGELLNAGLPLLPLKALKAIAAGAKAADAVGDTAKGIRAYHGSPHDFDRFALEKIGTGEGAQAYGHGLYFAEHPTTAEMYRNNLAGQPEIKNLKLGRLNVGEHNAFDYSPKGNSIYENVRSSLAEDLLIDQASLTGVPPDQLQAHVLKRLDQKIADYTKEWPEAVADAQRLRKELARPKAVGLTYGERPGKSYEVNINADPAHFLDWDAPLSQQPDAVQRAVERITKEPYPTATGEEVYRNVLPAHGIGRYEDKDLASQALREAGIPGIRYLDQGSRARTGGELIDVFKGPEGWQSKIRVHRGGDTHFTTSAPHPTREAAEQWAQSQISGGTRNYVVFDDALVDILRKYGVLPPIGLATLGQYGQRSQGHAK